MTAATGADPQAAAGPKERIGFSAWWMLAVLFLFYFIAWVDRYSLTMMVEPIKADLGLSDFRMSLILGPAFAVFYGVFGLPLGLAADRFSRRWVIFKGYAEASKVPPDWHGWLHHTFAEPPTVEPLMKRSWEKEHRPNLSGTQYAWRPTGSIARTGKRPPATGDYEAWTPE